MADLGLKMAPGGARGQTGRFGLKNGLRGRWAGPEAKRANCANNLASGRRRAGPETKMANLSLKRASRGDGPAQKPKWPFFP